MSTDRLANHVLARGSSACLITLLLIHLAGAVGCLLGRSPGATIDRPALLLTRLRATYNWPWAKASGYRHRPTCCNDDDAQCGLRECLEAERDPEAEWDPGCRMSQYQRTILVGLAAEGLLHGAERLQVAQKYIERVVERKEMARKVGTTRFGG